ncbi:MAG: rhodanese-like domain-containing protein, partial [Bacillota bacterium]
IAADELSHSLKTRRNQKERAIVYQLRSRASHDTVGIPGMISLTMAQKINPLGLPVYRDPHLSPETLLKHKEKIKGLSDRRKEVPIILVGENEYDWAPYKTAVIMKGMGFKNIRWYRKGVVEWKLRHIFDKEKFPLAPEPAFKLLDL